MIKKLKKLFNKDLKREIKTTLPANVLKKYISPYFFETGTADGDAVRLALELGFEKIFTIEIDPFLYEKNIKRYRHSIDEGKVFMFLGDTYKLMPSIIQTHIDKPTTFWLDAHQDFGPGGFKKCPLVEELNYIKKSSLEHILLIDDRRMFGTWWGEGIDEELIVEKIKEIDPRYEISYEDGHVPDDIIAAKIV